MSAAVVGLPVSVQVRLVRHAKAIGMDPNLVLARFAVERFLYRLSRSRHGERFVLKGALLLLVWLGETTRPTRDADLLGFGEITEKSLLAMFTEVCRLDVEPDGIEYLPASLRVAPIRLEDVYGGLRAVLQSRLGKARIRVQIDVGIGDAVTPEPEWLEYPALLDFPRPWLRAYRAETAIAEKMHAMVVLGEANTRMRDFFDIHVLAQHNHFDGDRLANAVRATFERRHTHVPESPPLALTPRFAAHPEKRMQWQAFVRKSALTRAPADFGVMVAELANFLGPVIDAARGDVPLPLVWQPRGPWRPRS